MFPSLLAASLLLVPVHAETPEEDPLALASRLLADGHLDRAATVLAEVTDEHEDVARLYTLRGLVHARAARHPEAAAAFERALREGGDPLLGLHLARTRLSLGDPDAAIEALDASGETGAAVKASWLLRAEAHRVLKQPDQAWVELTRGEARFPDQPIFARQRVLVLLDLGLYQQAIETGTELLAAHPDDLTAWRAYAEALIRAGRARDAVDVLEAARLANMGDPDIHGQLAKAWLDAGHPGAAGQVLTVAAESDPSLYPQAAECFRRAGDLDRALYLNGYVPDPAEKGRQRLGLYVEDEAWSRVVALESRLERLDVTEEDPVAYALAFAWFRLGEIDRSEHWLKTIDDPRLFKDATALRETMAACSESPAGCR